MLYFPEDICLNVIVSQNYFSGQKRGYCNTTHLLLKGGIVGLRTTALNSAESRDRTVLLLLLLSRFSRARLCATPQTAAHQAPPPMGFSRQEYWSGLPLPQSINQLNFLSLFLSPFSIPYSSSFPPLHYFLLPFFLYLMCTIILLHIKFCHKLLKCNRSE